MFKRLIFSLPLSLIFYAVVSFELGNIMRPLSTRDNSPGMITIGDTSPPWWENGLPFKAVNYMDCPSGCIPQSNLLIVIVNYLFWSLLIYFFCLRQKHILLGIIAYLVLLLIVPLIVYIRASGIS